MTREPTRALTVKIAEFQGQAQCEGMLGHCVVMHFVGVGLKVFCFPKSKLANKKGFVTTCWSAVHSREWGDNTLDFQMYRRVNGIFV